VSLSDKAKNYILSMTNADIAGAAMLAALLSCAWILLFVGFRPPFANEEFFRLVDHVAYPLLLVLPVSLALALRTPVGVFLATPYLVPIAWHLIENLLARQDGIAPVTSSRLFAATVIIFVVPFVLTHMLRKVRETDKAKAYRVVGGLQMLILAVAVYYFTYHYGVQHLAQPVVSVQRLRFWAPPLTFPLVEEEAAFVVDRRGRLFRIDLASGRKRVIAQIPRPSPADVGFGNMTLERATGWWSPFRNEGVLTRIDHSTLYFRYHYIDLFNIHARINELTGEVDWNLHKRTGVTDPPPVFWETVSQGTAISVLGGGARYFNVLIQGENIRTAIDPLGWVDWRQAEHGWGLLGTSRGHVIIVTVKEPRGNSPGAPS